MKTFFYDLMCAGIFVLVAFGAAIVYFINLGA